MGKEAKKEVKISPRKLEKIKRKLAEFEALKKALTNSSRGSCFLGTKQN